MFYKNLPRVGYNNEKSIHYRKIIMTIHTTIQSILEQAQAGKAPTREECISLLQLPEQSYESALLRATADQLSRAKFGHAGMLLAQIGIEIAPCRANCKFCSFARINTDLPVHKMSLEDILLHGKNLSAHETALAVSNDHARF
jgi:2-iminoacetate synthase ThiH